MANEGYSTVPGDPFGTKKEPVNKLSPSPREVDFMHQRADTDSSQGAIHHSLGMKNGQASPGDHKHNGLNSRRIMEGITITGAKGGNVALANLITALAASLGFTDNTT